MQNIALDDASTSFTVKAIPNYYDYPSDFKNKLSHRVTLWNYINAGNGVPSISGTEVNNKLTYPTDVLTKGGSGYSSQTTSVPMTVIYTMDTKKNPLPSGLTLITSTVPQYLFTYTRTTTQTYTSTYTSKSPSYSSYPVTITARLVYITKQPYIKAGEGKARHIAISEITAYRTFFTSYTHTIYSYANPSLKARVLLYTQSQSNVSITPILYGSFSISTYVLVDTTGATSGSTGLPKGLSIDTTKGEITGSIDGGVTPGEYKVSFYAFASPVATLRIPSYLVTYTFYVLPSNSSSVHALTSPSRTASVTFMSTTYTNLSYTVTNTTETSPTGSGGLPKGLTLDTTKGEITGSIDTGVTPGEYVAIITVTYSSNSKTEVSPSTVTYTHTFLVDQSTTPSLSNQATGVSIGQTNITITPKTTGYITSYTVASTDATSGGTSANGLPKGLTLNSSGTITGSIDTSVSQGIYTVVVTGTAPTVTNNATTLTSTIVSATYTFLVTSTTPGLSSTATGVSIGQTNITITPTTQGYITSYTVTNTTETSPTGSGGLPKGLTLDTTKGTITGSIDTGVTTGLYKVTITATAPSYSSSATTLTSTIVSAVYTICVYNSLGLAYLGYLVTQPYKDIYNYFKGSDDCGHTAPWVANAAAAGLLGLIGGLAALPTRKSTTKIPTTKKTTTKRTTRRTTQPPITIPKPTATTLTPRTTNRVRFTSRASQLQSNLPFRSNYLSPDLISPSISYTSQDLVVTVYKHASSVYMTQVLGPATYSLPNFVTYDTDPGVNRVPVYLFLNTTDGRLSGSVEANTGTYTFPVVVNGVYTVPYTVVVTELPSQDLVVTVYKHASSVYMTQVLGPATYSLPNFVTYDTDPGVNRVPVYLFLNTTDGRLSGSVEANTGTYTFPVVVNGVYTVPYTVVVTELPSQDLVVTVYKHASSVYMTQVLGPATYSLPNFVTYDTDPGVNRVPVYLFLNTTDGRLSGSVEANTGTYTFPVVVNGVYTVPYTVVVTELPSQDLVVTVYKHASSVYMTQVLGPATYSLPNFVTYDTDPGVNRVPVYLFLNTTDGRLSGSVEANTGTYTFPVVVNGVYTVPYTVVVTELPSQDLVVTVYKHASSVYMTQVLGPATYSLPNFVTYDTDPGVNRVPVYLFLNTTDGRLSGSVEANTGTYTFPVVVNGVYTVPYTVVVTELPSQV
ncbi:putative Ig domain-containing protein [Tropheryma whipplei]|nr:putative Ig domain-containing protein [Tropheryma whipplei]